MKRSRRRVLQLAGAAAASLSALAALPRRAIAQSWPNRPLRWIIGYPAGGSTDLVARIMGQRLSERIGQPVVIDNRPGAATNLATQAVVNATPDGHTLLLAVATNAINACSTSSCRSISCATSPRWRASRNFRWCWRSRPRCRSAT
jgi:tripartite-type tricarboxylate transporter receptor subunit TctC